MWSKLQQCSMYQIDITLFVDEIDHKNSIVHKWMKCHPINEIDYFE